jgi:hypothetical protein
MYVRLFRQQGTFSIFMNIWDSDSGNLFGIGGARDRIDIVYGKYQYLVAGADSASPMTYQKTVSMRPGLYYFQSRIYARKHFTL